MLVEILDATLIRRYGGRIQEIDPKMGQILIEKRLAKIIKKDKQIIVEQKEEDTEKDDNDEDKIKKYSKRKTIFPKSIINDEEKEDNST